MVSALQKRAGIMTSLPKNLAIACTTLLLACGGQAAEPSSSGAPSGASPAGGETDSTNAEVPRAPFCDASRSASRRTWVLDMLSSSSSAPYLALRVNAGGVPSPGLTKELVTVAERGELCAGATDVAKCKNAYAALSPDISIRDHHCFTRGDEVGCLETKADAMAFLGEVRSVDEAIFIASYDLYYAQCTEPKTIARGMKLADGSFGLSLQKGGGCSDVVYRAALTVTKDGTVTEIDADETDLSYPCP